MVGWNLILERHQNYTLFALIDIGLVDLRSCHGATYSRDAHPAHPPRSYPRDERKELQSNANPSDKNREIQGSGVGVVLNDLRANLSVGSEALYVTNWRGKPKYQGEEADTINYNIPQQYEPQIQEFAHAQHISESEVLDRIFKAGLEHYVPTSVSPRDILGAFSSKEESAIADEALELVMKDRLRRNSQAPHG